jgi:hypothetical protein
MDPRVAHCRRGHPLTPENLVDHPLGWRRCGACERARAQRRRDRRAA